MCRIAASVALALLFGALLAGQQSDANRSPLSAQSNPISGKQVYVSYCSMCHGADGRGGGPFSPQLKVWPPDLTRLTSKNHGVFPALHVAEVIDGEFEKPAHGSKEMPVWGPVFR